MLTKTKEGVKTSKCITAIQGSPIVITATPKEAWLLLLTAPSLIGVTIGHQMSMKFDCHSCGKWAAEINMRFYCMFCSCPIRASGARISDTLIC